MKFLRYILPVALLTLAASCEDQNKNTTPPATFDAFVTGTVSDSSGNPVNNANILVEFSFAGCEDSDSSFISGGVAESDVDGKFREDMLHPIQETIKCLRLTASGPRGSSLHTTTVMRNVEVTLKHFEPADTITMNIRFPN